MNLEDNLGDIIRKARAMSGVTTQAAAGAGGITEGELSSIESSGAIRGKLNFNALAAKLGLNGDKLERIAKGWLPARQEVSRWRHLRQITTDEGMAVNCYLIWDESSREAALFDTGWSAEPILEILASEKLTLKELFITHSHEDHIACLDRIRGAHPAARVHGGGRGDTSQTPPSARAPIAVGKLRVSQRETPGHAVDGITYVIEGWAASAPPVAVVGDAIFAGSMGRGNISWDTARNKVREAILTLHADTLVCPGHGPLTTVGEEKANNPFF